MEREGDHSLRSTNHQKSKRKERYYGSARRQKVENLNYKDDGVKINQIEIGNHPHYNLVGCLICPALIILKSQCS
jgi:hypothetical protein